MVGITPFIDFRVFVLVKVSWFFGEPLIAPVQTDLPLLGFHLLRVLTLNSVQDLHPTTVTLQELRVCCQIKNSLRSTA
jgi:hypothetical protein